MKKNIVTIILAILVVITIIGGSILGVKYFELEEKLMDQKEESNKDILEKNDEAENNEEEKDNTVSDQKGESVFYASDDDRYVLILSTYKDRKYQNPKGGINDSNQFFMSIDNYQSFDYYGGTYRIENDKIIFYVTAGCIGSDGSFSCSLPDNVDPIINAGTNQITVSYTENEIMFGNVKLTRK